MTRTFHSEVLNDIRRAARNDDRRCEWPGCDEDGVHKAPRSRSELRSYRWFCVDHIREFNKTWNYYDGMSDSEVEADVRRDTVWNRPTWPLGTNGSGDGFDGFAAHNIHDPFGFMSGEAAGATAGADSRKENLSSDQRGALAVFGMDSIGNLESVKQRYKDLVKRHHPDAVENRGGSEEKMKEINQAYRVLLDFLGA